MASRSAMTKGSTAAGGHLDRRVSAIGTANSKISSPRPAATEAEQKRPSLPTHGQTV